MATSRKNCISHRGGFLTGDLNNPDTIVLWAWRNSDLEKEIYDEVVELDIPSVILRMVEWNLGDNNTTPN